MSYLIGVREGKNQEVICSKVDFCLKKMIVKILLFLYNNYMYLYCEVIKIVFMNVY